MVGGEVLARCGGRGNGVRREMKKKEREGLGWTRLGRHRSCLSAATFVVVLNVLFVKKV
jgi:hypothetical protein